MLNKSNKTDIEYKYFLDKSSNTVKCLPIWVVNDIRAGNYPSSIVSWAEFPEEFSYLTPAHTQNITVDYVNVHDFLNHYIEVPKSKALEVLYGK